jgi:glyoxylase-like metal-dependent hydrolase (beta-lactamase superfamily II)/rhodanese-related sulfurtransferase
MYIQQLYTNCLAQAAYYIESNGEVAIIDPLRDIESYIKLANERNAKIKYIFETHFHADFVSGHIDLANETGAEIIFGPDATPKYAAHIAFDNQQFKLGNCMLELLHTPGHTIESICILLYNEEGKKYSIFTGDTLFVGDVGRPDLLSGNLSKEVLASMLFDSLNNKIKNLPEDVIVYPGHGPGSACGRNLGKETTSTIGEQLKLNYALQPMSREEFVESVTKNQPIPPAYFFKDAAINKQGYDSFDGVIQKSLKCLTPEDFKSSLKEDVIVLDVRTPEKYALAHVKNSINIGLNGAFAIWAGTIIPVSQPLIIVCDLLKERETIIRLARVGFENIVGYWDEDVHSLKTVGIEIKHTNCVDAMDIKLEFENDDLQVLDVRNASEYETTHLKNALHIPLNSLETKLIELNPEFEYAVYCAGGYRSMIAASILERNGFKNVVNINGGMGSILKDAKEFVEESADILS